MAHFIKIDPIDSLRQRMDEQNHLFLKYFTRSGTSHRAVDNFRLLHVLRRRRRKRHVDNFWSVNVVTVATLLGLASNWRISTLDQRSGGKINNNKTRIVF